ncbi:MAG: nucleotide exchange factor GrpE [Chloroflexota bacterium]
MSEEDTTPEATAASDDVDATQPEAEAPRPEDELVACRAQVEEYLRQWQRAQADFINYKRRVQQEQEQLQGFANAELMRQVLPALDDFERAIAAMPAFAGSEQELWAQGVVSIVRKLQESLARAGLQAIDSVGQEFNPNEHEAVLNVAAPAAMDGQVTAEVRKGYKLHDRVLRAAQVVVGKAEEAS